MKPLVYIASPYRSNPCWNTRHAIVYASGLMADGVVTPLVPHLSLLFDTVCPQPPDDWLTYDLELLRRCDGLIRPREIDGPSAGADGEERFARENGIPVFYDKDTLYAWVKEWAR